LANGQLTYGQKGRGKGQKGKRIMGKCAQGKQENGGPSIEDAEILEFKREMAKLQLVGKTLSDMGGNEESLVQVRAKIKEARKNTNGGVEQTRAEKAQSLLQRKNDKTKAKKWLKHQIQDCGTKLMVLNEQYKHNVVDIDGINLDLAD
jgi:hypothetical protein